jgi:two-component SAPR family response regulator
MKMEMLEVVGRCMLAEGESREAVSKLSMLARQEPLREVFTELLMRAYARCDMFPQAIEVFEWHRRYLADEYGLEISQRMRELHVAVLRRESI